MIQIGNKRVYRTILNGRDPDRIHLGPLAIYARVTELLNRFAGKVIADGGIYDDLFASEVLRQNPIVLHEARVLIVPGAYKAGVIYGIDMVTGEPVPFTFGRASVGTYIDKNGNLQTAGNNIPRIDYDQITGVLRGYLFENAATQFIKNSILSDAANWGYTSINVTYNTGTTSLGRPLNTLAKSDSSPNRPAVSSAQSSSAGATYCFRGTFRAGSASRVSLGIGASADGTGNPIWGADLETGYRIVSGPGTISRVSGSLSTVTGLSALQDTIIEVFRKYNNAAIPVSVYVYPDSSASTTLGASIQFSTPQCEINALGVCTSQIDTTNSQATRAADSLTGPGSLITETGCTVYMEGARLSSGQGGSWMFSRGAEARIWYTSGLVHQIAQYDGVTTLYAPGNQTNGETVKVVGSVGAEGQKINRNNTIGKSAYDGTFGTGNLFIGGSEGSPGRVQNHIRALAIMQRQLSDAEHVQLVQP